MKVKLKDKDRKVPTHIYGQKQPLLKKTDRLVEYLPWNYYVTRYLTIDSETIIQMCIVVQKDKSIQQTYAFRGLDTESFSDAYIASIFEYFNNQIKRLGDGWMVSVEAQRYQSHEYPSSNFTNLAAYLVDKEREESFVNSGEHYESCYYLTFVYKPEAEIKRKAMSFFFKEEEREILINEEIDKFVNKVELLTSVLSSRLIIRPLDVEETLCFLHSTVSCKRHGINIGESFMYMDSYIRGDNLEVASTCKLGDYYIPIVTITDFPLRTYPCILNKLNKLDVEYRWVSRFFPLSKKESLKKLSECQQSAASSSKSSSQLANELVLGVETTLKNYSGAMALSEIEEAQSEVGGDLIALGYYQTSVMVWDENYTMAQEKRKKVEQVIEECQFESKEEAIASLSAFLGMVGGNTISNQQRALITSMNYSHTLPFSAIWSGLCENKYMGEVCGIDKPLVTCATNYGSIFNLNLNDGDVGHTLILGPTGSGKSTLLNLLAVSALKYPNIQVFFMDYGLSSLTLTLAVGGDYINPADNTVCFQPLQNVDVESEYVWACDFIKTLLKLQGVKMEADMNSAIEEAMNAVAQAPVELRTLSYFRLNLEYRDEKGRNVLDDALLPYCRNGRYGFIFDGDHTTLKENFWVLFEMESLMDMGEEASAPAILFIFHFLESCFTGRLTFFIMDECWFGLQNKAIASKMKEYLLTLRKRNVFCIFATQNPSAVAQSPLATTMIQNCPTQIFLADPKALKLKEDYQKLGLSDEEINLLSLCTKKRDYYYKSSLGTRLFQLNLGEIELALFRGKESKYKDKNGEVKSWESFLHSLVEDKKNNQVRKKYVDLILDKQNINWRKFVQNIDIREFLS